jgi:hypothetical protein
MNQIENRVVIVSKSCYFFLGINYTVYRVPYLLVQNQLQVASHSKRQITGCLFFKYKRSRRQLIRMILGLASPKSKDHILKTP